MIYIDTYPLIFQFKLCASSMYFLNILLYTTNYNFQIAVILMRPLSPIRSASPINRPRITFNYPPSPLKQHHLNTHICSPPLKQSTTKVKNNVCESKVEKYLIDNDKCSVCTNTVKKIIIQPTHKSIKEGNCYCSSCALLVIKKGVEVVRIDLK